MAPKRKADGSLQQNHVCDESHKVCQQDFDIRSNFSFSLRSPEFADVTIKINKELILAHKVILIQYQYFRNILVSKDKATDPTNVIDFSKEDADAVSAVVRWIYTRRCDPVAYGTSKENPHSSKARYMPHVKAYILATRFGVQCLKSECTKTMSRVLHRDREDHISGFQIYKERALIYAVQELYKNIPSNDCQMKHLLVEYFNKTGFTWNGQDSVNSHKVEIFDAFASAVSYNKTAMEDTGGFLLDYISYSQNAIPTTRTNVRGSKRLRFKTENSEDSSLLEFD